MAAGDDTLRRLGGPGLQPDGDTSTGSTASCSATAASTDSLNDRPGPTCCPDIGRRVQQSLRYPGQRTRPLDLRSDDLQNVDPEVVAVGYQEVQERFDGVPVRALRDLAGLRVP